MDEFNNNNNNEFGEESFAEAEKRAENADIPQDDPYNQPYGVNNASSQPSQNKYDPYARQNPYNMPYGAQQSPYNMPLQNPYGQPQQGGYNQNAQNGGQQPYDPYKQPYDPYKQPYDPYKQPYDPYKQNPYGGYPQTYPYQPNGYKTGMATASLVIGIISLVSVMTLIIWVFPPLLVMPVVGVILGAVYKTKGYPVGKGASTAGIITSAIAIVLAVITIAVVIVVMVNYMPQLMQFIKDYSPELYKQYYDQFYKQYPQWFENVAALIGFFSGK